MTEMKRPTEITTRVTIIINENADGLLDLQSNRCTMNLQLQNSCDLKLYAGLHTAERSSRLLAFKTERRL
jgi:hypothetical protein